MKRYVLITAFAACATVLPAQSNDGGPALNPDLMTYFQEEMTSFMRYQSRLEYNTPFYLSGRFRAVAMGNEEYGAVDSDWDRGARESAANGNANLLIGAQIKINDLFYIPVFAALAGTVWMGEPDAGTLNIENVQQYAHARISEYNDSWLFGSGLFFNGETLKGGVFAGYNVKHRIDQVEWTSGWLSIIQSRKEDVHTDSFKIALLPILDTSKWRYVGQALDSVLGYIGTGDIIDIYAGEEKNNTADSIVSALNYGLNLGFKNFEFNKVSLGLECLYRRDNYDIIAKNDTYGAVLTFRTVFNSFAFALTPELGFKRFYSVSEYFASKYPDTAYCNIGLSFFFNKFSLKLFYRYDKIVLSNFGIIFNVKEALSLLFDIGAHAKEYTAETGKVVESAATLGAGIRYRYGGIIGPNGNKSGF
jgi:hypothetical protein